MQARRRPKAGPSGRDRRGGLPRHERAAIAFVLRHAAYGVAGAVTFMIGLVWTDAGGLGTLALGSEHGPVALAMLFAGLCVTFCGVAIGVGVMRLGRDEN